MFSSKKKADTINTSIINTIIGNNSSIEGVLTASESTRIDGLLEGKIMSESSVIVGETGTVKGDITAVEILVAGIVYGNLIAKERIQLTSTGRVLGDLITRTLVIDEGASFKGNCTMDMKGIELPDLPASEELPVSLDEAYSPEDLPASLDEPHSPGKLADAQEELHNARELSDAQEELNSPEKPGSAREELHSPQEDTRSQKAKNHKNRKNEPERHTDKPAAAKA